MATVFMLHPSLSQPSWQDPWNGHPPASTTNLAWERYYIEGFTWPTSVKQGETINAYVSVRSYNNDSSYTATVYRMPNNATSLWGPTNDTGRFFPLHDSNNVEIFPNDYSRQPVEYKEGCLRYWNAAFSIPIPNDTIWKSGLYYIQLNHLSLPEGHDEKYYNVPFIVRSANPGSASKILFKFPLNTFQAYNYWGGGSLYSRSQHNSLAVTNLIAIDRPLSKGFSIAMNHPFLGTLNSPFMKVMDTLGYQMEFCNNIDIDSIPSSPNEEVGLNLLSRYNALVLFGHDEYWAQFERRHTEEFKGNTLHGNIACFAANTCYWHIAWQSGSGHSKMYCAKWNLPPGTASDLWREPGGHNNPESKLLGEQYQYGGNVITAADPSVEEPPSRVRLPNHWIYRGTGLTTNQDFGRGWHAAIGSLYLEHGIAAQELDNTLTGPTTHPVEIIAERDVWSRGIGSCDTCHGYIRHQMTYYEDTTSNARVFASGCTN
jgi:hypothetical protein